MQTDAANIHYTNLPAELEAARTSRLHAALDVERQLPTQEQILDLDRLARSKGEPQPSQHFSHQFDQNLRKFQHVPIMPSRV